MVFIAETQMTQRISERELSEWRQDIVAMNRIELKFKDLQAKDAKALIPYITPEFPFRGITLPLLFELEKSGADLIEIGVPFSDPLADGSVIQRSSEVALSYGVNVTSVLSYVRSFRDKSELPVLLMGYVNPVLRYGVASFLKDCAHAGVDGLIIPDLPPEEAQTLEEASSKEGISNVFLVAPTTTNERIQEIDRHSTHFSYCVSVTGVTGARLQIGENGSLAEFLRRVKANVRKKFVVGFGISQRHHVREAWKYADGAVVGSALIAQMNEAGSLQEAVQSAGVFLKSIRPQ